MADWFETRFKEPVDGGEPDPAFVARMRALVVEEWDTDHHHHEGDIIMLQTEERPGEQDAPTAGGPRRPSRGRLAAAAVAAVALIGALVLAAGDDDTDVVDTADETTEDVTPTTTVPAAPSGPRDVTRMPGEVELAKGRYVIDPDRDEATPLRVTFEIAHGGWDPWFGTIKSVPGDAGYTGVMITTIPNVVKDGCLDHTLLDPPVGPTVDDLAGALATLRPFDVVAPPTDVTLLGHAGKHLMLRVPDLAEVDAENYHDFAGCVDGELHSWVAPHNDGSFYGYDGPGQLEEIWILDVDGTRLVLVKNTAPLSPAEDIAERDAIFDSIRIEP